MTSPRELAERLATEMCFLESKWENGVPLYFMTHDELEAFTKRVMAEAMEETHSLCDQAVPRAHTYASENADIYRAGDAARDRIKSAIQKRIKELSQ